MRTEMEEQFYTTLFHFIITWCNNTNKYNVTVPGKRAHVAQIMIFLYRLFLVLPHLKTILWTKLLCLSQRYLPLFAYTHAKFERVEASSKRSSALFKDSYLIVLFHTMISIDTGIGMAKESLIKKMEQCLKELSLYLCVPIIVLLLTRHNSSYWRSWPSPPWLLNLAYYSVLKTPELKWKKRLAV